MYNCDTKECVDTIDTDFFCKLYKRKGICDTHYYAKRHCKKTCNNCDFCMDNYGRKKCKNLLYHGKCCEKEVMENCMKTCNLCGII